MKTQQCATKPKMLSLALAAVLLAGVTGSLFACTTSAGDVLAGAGTTAQANFDPTGNGAPLANTGAQTPAYYNAYASIDPASVDRIISQGDFAWDLTNPYYFYDNTAIAALVRIDSIDGGKSYNEVLGEYIYPHTYGSMTILDVYKGEVAVGETLSYIRIGAIIKFDEYYNSLNEQQKEKYDFLSEGQRPEKEFVEERFEDDILLEAGKVYVVFLHQNTSADGQKHEYNMLGLQFGLHEANGYGEGAGAGEAITVLNNVTGEWESLNSIIKR